MNKEVSEFVNYWQKFMICWERYMSETYSNKENPFNEQGVLSNFGRVDTFITDSFPEPYFGDPRNLEKNNIQAIFINLNPGSSSEQHSFVKNGNLVKAFIDNNKNYLQTIIALEYNFYHFTRLQKDKYYRTNHKIENIKNISIPVAKPTYNWWHRYRANWINEFLKPTNIKNEIVISNIIGIELVPWHTNSFSQVQKLIDRSFVVEKIIPWAVSFSKLVQNEYLRKGSSSIILTCGKGFKNFFEAEQWKRITPNFLSGAWEVWRWKYNKNTLILNFHQIKIKGIVSLNYPNKLEYKKPMKDFISLLLKEISE